jgi:hypothetical protein
MQIQINTDRNISGHEALSHKVEALIQHALHRFADRITRVEAHLSDVNGAAKPGPHDKRCVLEVRLSGLQPMSVNETAETLDQAVNGASKKMLSMLDTSVGRLNKIDRSVPDLETSE